MRACFLLLVLAAGASCAPREMPRATTTDPVEPVLAERPDAAWDGRLRIASVFPTLGRYALSGLQSHRGAELAVRDVNASGGIHGRTLKLVPYRTGSHVVDARRAAELAAHEGVLAIVGSNSSALSRAVAQVAETRAIPQVSNVSTAGDLTWDPATGRDRAFVFRVCGSDAAMGSALATFVAGHLRARRAAVLYEVGREYSARLAGSFLAHFDAPGRTSARFVYLPLEIDFRTQLAAIRDFGADVVFVPGSFTDATLVAMQAEALGVGATLVGGDGWSNARLFRRGGPARPAYFADHCAPPAGFAARYRAAFGEEPEGCRAVLAHDAVLALADALRRLGALDDAALTSVADATRRRLRDALATSVLDGAAGPLRFDAHGDVRRPVTILEWRPGHGTGLHALVEPRG